MSPINKADLAPVILTEKRIKAGPTREMDGKNRSDMRKQRCLLDNPLAPQMLYYLNSLCVGIHLSLPAPARVNRLTAG